MMLAFEELCEPELWEPAFVMDHPLESTPLCKVHRNDPTLVERFEPAIAGMEVGNSYSELNDPIVQRRLLEEQVERGRGGEDETHPLDEDFLRAMEYGMPPMGGVGIGIDRMTMLLTDQASIRDVLLFPLQKPGVRQNLSGPEVVERLAERRAFFHWAPGRAACRVSSPLFTRGDAKFCVPPDSQRLRCPGPIGRHPWRETPEYQVPIGSSSACKDLRFITSMLDPYLRT
jgi:hypothetical protein